MIETILLRCLDPSRQRRFYTHVLGMRGFDDHRVGYGATEAALQFTKAQAPYASSSKDRYWKIALAVPDIELACRQLARDGIAVDGPAQFLDVGYLAHFKDPEGFTVEVIDHAFAGPARVPRDVDQTRFGGGAHLNLLTLRTANIERAQERCLALGMTALCTQSVPAHDFTLYFYAWTKDRPPRADLSAIENRSWLYRRPYTLLELQHRAGAQALNVAEPLSAGYAGFWGGRDGAPPQLLDAAGPFEAVSPPGP
ncbi:MAG: VOC family protein [Pseudomonadota bacterium]